MCNGVAVSVTSFARALTEMGHRVTIFTVHHPDQQEEEAGVYRFPSVTLPTRARYPLAIPIAPSDARRILEEQHFDVIHSHSLMLMGHIAQIYQHRLQVPLVFTYHTLIEEYVHYIPLPQAMMKHSAVSISRDYSNTADHVITPATHVAERLRRYQVTKPITVIPTGIELDVIDAVPAGSIRVQYAIPPAAPLLAYVGRIAREKNIPRLLGAFRLVLQHEPAAHLLLIGGGPLEGEIKAMIGDLGLTSHVHMTGFVPRTQVIQGMREANLFLFASKTETQGLVLGEAMACNLPVVAVEADAPGEIVTPMNEGMLTPDEDEPFADAVLSLLANPSQRVEMGRQARQRAESLSVLRCTERLVDVYRQVIAERDESAKAS